MKQELTLGGRGSAARMATNERRGGGWWAGRPVPRRCARPRQRGGSGRRRRALGLSGRGAGTDAVGSGTGGTRRDGQQRLRPWITTSRPMTTCSRRRTGTGTCSSTQPGRSSRGRWAHPRPLSWRTSRGAAGTRPRRPLHRCGGAGARPAGGWRCAAWRGEAAGTRGRAGRAGDGGAEREVPRRSPRSSRRRPGHGLSARRCARAGPGRRRAVAGPLRIPPAPPPPPVPRPRRPAAGR